MEKIATTLNPIFAHLKYLLFTLSLVLALIVVVQFVLQDLNIDASFSGKVGQTLIPLMITGSVSMYLGKKFQKKKG